MNAKKFPSGAAPGKARRGRFVLGLMLLAAFGLGLYIGSILPGLVRDASDSGEIRKEALQPGPAASREDPEPRRLEEAVKAAPRDAEAWNALGHWNFDHDFPLEAIKAYESSLFVRPDDPDILTDLGVMYRAIHEHERALQLFRKASALRPEHLQSRYNEGVALFYDLDRRDEGMRVWAELARKAPAYKTPAGDSLADLVADYFKREKP